MVGGSISGLVLIFLLLRRNFKTIAAEALLKNNQAFVDLARASLEKFQSEAKGELALKQQSIQGLVNPLRETLGKYERQLLEMERKREQAYGGIRQYLESAVNAQTELRKETSNLVKALRAPNVRGKWGEMSLRRVVEIAGLLEHCDFEEQETISGEDSRLRPDLTIYLPNNRKIVIDAKVPLDSYLKAIEMENDEEQERLIAEHSRHLHRHISLLGSKSYWDQLQGSPEFVILFIPLESLYSAALHHDPTLLEKGTLKKVILATPTTLIALLKSVDYGWKQEKLAQNAEQIAVIGKEMYDRLFKLAEHLSKLGTNLDRAVQAYNETAGSFEKRVFVQARRFLELGISARESISEIPWIDRSVHKLQENRIVNFLEKPAKDRLEDDSLTVQSSPS